MVAEQLTTQSTEPSDQLDIYDLQDFTGETRQVLTQQRIKQSFFVERY
jgi:hypothetical protein